MAQLLTAWLASGNHQGAAYLQQWSAQLGDHRQGSESSGCRHVELLSPRPSAVLLEALVDHPDVPNPEPCGCRHYPVQPPALCIHKRERCVSERGGERKSGEASARPKVYPMFPRCGSTQRSKTEGVLDMTLTQAFTLVGAEESEIDST